MNVGLQELKLCWGKRIMLNDKDLLKCCDASYADTEEEFKKLVNYDGKVEHYFGQSLHKFKFELEDCSVVVIRGTHTMIDVVSDLCCRPVDYSNTNVHAGFLDQLNAEALPDLTFDKNKKIYLTGHSLGGSLVTLYSLKIALLGYTNIEIVTFGAARSGCQSFKELLESKIENIRNYVCSDDLVPSLPFSFLKYKTIGNQIQIGKKYSWWNPMKLISIFKSHRLNSYKEALNAR